MQNKTPETGQAKPKRFAQIGHMLLGAFIGIFMVHYFYTHDIQFTVDGFFYILIIAILSFIATVIIHETGHAIGGKLGGMVVMNLSYGPFIYAKVDGRTRFFFKLPAMGYIGRAMLSFTEPVSEAEMRKSMLRFIYAGPLANLFTGIPALIWAYVNPSGALFTFGLVSLFLGLTNLGNIESKGAQTDGRLIAMLKDKQPGADLILISYQLLQEDPRASGKWSTASINRAEEVIERYKGWPLAASLLATIGPYYFTSNPQRFLELAEGRAFLPRSKQAGILQDITDVSVATGLYFANRLQDEPDIEAKLQLIGNQDAVSRHFRDAFLAIVRHQQNDALVALYEIDKTIGEWHPLYLEGVSLKYITQAIRSDLKTA